MLKLSNSRSARWLEVVCARSDLRGGDRFERLCVPLTSALGPQSRRVGSREKTPRTSLAPCALEPGRSAGLRPGATSWAASAPGRRPALRFMESFDLQLWRHVAAMNLGPRASVLDCGDGGFGVAALARDGSVGGEFRSLERGQGQSGDFADSVTALQNLADRRRFRGRTLRTSLAPCALEPARSAALARQSRRTCERFRTDVANRMAGISIRARFPTRTQLADSPPRLVSPPRLGFGAWSLAVRIWRFRKEGGEQAPRRREYALLLRRHRRVLWSAAACRRFASQLGKARAAIGELASMGCLA